MINIINDELELEDEDTYLYTQKSYLSQQSPSPTYEKWHIFRG